MLIDEITEGLATLRDRALGRGAARRARHRVAILLVEQNVSFALSVADRYAILKLGEIVDEGGAGDEVRPARIAG